MDKKAWQGQTLQAAEGIKTAVSVLGKKKKGKTLHLFCSISTYTEGCWHTLY